MHNTDDEVVMNSLQKQLFNALKTSNQPEATVFLLSQNIVRTVNLLSKDLSPYNIDSYTTQIQSLKPDLNQIGKISQILKNMFPNDKYKELREIIDLPLFNIVRAKHIIERELEIKNRTTINFEQSPEFKYVRESLEDKVVAHQNEFLKKGNKEIGHFTGYIASRESTNDTFLLKQFYKSEEGCFSEDNIGSPRQAVDNRICAIQGLIAAPMYELLLYARASKEALVQPNESNLNSLYIRSKFLKGAVLLSEFSRKNSAEAAREYQDQPIIKFYSDSQALQKLDGFEKVIAACQIQGDRDCTAENLMVQTQVADGKEWNIVVKIDHGLSFIDYILNFANMVDLLYHYFTSTLYYYEAMKNGNLSFNIEKYNEALKQMLPQLNENQVDSIVDNKVDVLKKYGFDLKGIKLMRCEENITSFTPINSFDDLREYYKENIKAHLTNMREIAVSVDIVSKFSNVSSDFKKGQWLETFANSSIKDPIAYAAHHNIEIEGKNALKWAYMHEHKIKIHDGYINTRAI